MIVTGFDLGMNTPGGYGQYIRVPSQWAVKLPTGLSLRESMMLGTAGFTAALSVDRLNQAGVKPESGEVLVTGATGGVVITSYSIHYTKLYEQTSRPRVRFAMETEQLRYQRGNERTRPDSQSEGIARNGPAD